MWRAHQSSSSPHQRTTSLSCQTSVSAVGEKKGVSAFNQWLNWWSTGRIISSGCNFHSFAVPLELFELTRQSCPAEPPIWRASLERQRVNNHSTLNETRELDLLPDKHNALENANFSRTASCGSIWWLSIKLPRSSLVFPLGERIFRTDTNLCNTRRFGWNMKWCALTYSLTV